MNLYLNVISIGFIFNYFHFKARPSHLTTVDAAFEGPLEGVAFEGREGRVLRSMQPLNWEYIYCFPLVH